MSEANSDNIERLIGRLKAARRRLAYHSRTGHGASKTRLPSGEAKSLARADVERLSSMLADARTSNVSLDNCSLPTCADADKGGCWWGGKQVRASHEWYMNGVNDAVCRQCGKRAVLKANVSRQTHAVNEDKK
jgi:hypothetical protein